MEKTSARERAERPPRPFPRVSGGTAKINPHAVVGDVETEDAWVRNDHAVTSSTGHALSGVATLLGDCSAAKNPRLYGDDELGVGSVALQCLADGSCAGAHPHGRSLRLPRTSSPLFR